MDINCYTKCKICKKEIGNKFDEINIRSVNNGEIYFQTIICKKCAKKTFQHEKNTPVHESFGWNGSAT